MQYVYVGLHVTKFPNKCLYCKIKWSIVGQFQFLGVLTHNNV